MSKRAKFVLVTWVGQNVSVMKKAKMSTDKALLKDIIQVSASIKSQCGQVLCDFTISNFKAKTLKNYMKFKMKKGLFPESSLSVTSLF